MLRFPNPCRSFDTTKQRVCFWGYESSIEVSFFIDTDTLKLLSPEMSDIEPEFLRAFDAERERIHVMANNAYMRGSKGCYSHILTAEDARE